MSVQEAPMSGIDLVRSTTNFRSISTTNFDAWTSYELFKQSNVLTSCELFNSLKMFTRLLLWSSKGTCYRHWWHPTICSWLSTVPLIFQVLSYANFNFCCWSYIKIKIVISSILELLLLSASAEAIANKGNS